MPFENQFCDETNIDLPPEVGERLYRDAEDFITRRAHLLLDIAQIQGITLGQAESWRKGVGTGFVMAAMAIAKGTFDIKELTEACNSAATEVERIDAIDN